MQSAYKICFLKTEKLLREFSNAIDCKSSKNEEEQSMTKYVWG